MQLKLILSAVSVAVVLGACASMETKAPKASSALQSTKNNQVGGTVNFSQKGGKVLVEATVTGLTPGLHGFHIHEKGDCSSGDGMSAGAHFNPGAKPHGGPHLAERHAGDLGNLNADAGGKATLSLEVDGITLGEGANSIIGKGLIVHAGPDDYTTQPTGNSGGRVACGVIGQAGTVSSRY